MNDQRSSSSGVITPTSSQPGNSWTFEVAFMIHQVLFHATAIADHDDGRSHSCERMRHHHAS